MEEQIAKTERKKKISPNALLAAVAFIINVLPSLMQQVTIRFSVTNLLTTLPTILVAVVLLRMKKDTAVTVAFGIYMLPPIWWLREHFLTNNLLNVIAAVVSFAVILGCCSAYSSKGKAFCKKLWFLPLVCVIAENALRISQIPYLLTFNIGVFITSVAEILAFAFVGFWIKEK